MRWDIFCRVVDNFGDIGVCWRLARQLAAEHEADVSLWVDDLRAFASLCADVSVSAEQQRIGLVAVRHWRSDFPGVDAADVVIEAFGCGLPEAYLAAMARRGTSPAWINLEYLSAEDWVEGCHLLPSPHPRFPLTCHFFYPGFTPKTGGLVRERELMAARAKFDSTAEAAFWRGLHIPAPGNDEVCVSLFCYDNPALPQLLQCWAEGSTPIRLMVTPGAAARQTADWLGRDLTQGAMVQSGMLTIYALSFLSQADYDLLLWACDVNFVRGEDSFVRAQWAQRSFVWQIYPQREETHLVKLDAFLNRYLDGEASQLQCIRTLWLAWNGRGEIATSWQEFVASRDSIDAHANAWAGQLDRMPDLANNLARFVQEK